MPTRIGRTSASSVIVWARSSFNLFVVCGTSSPCSKICGALAVRGRGPRLLPGGLKEQPRQSCQCCHSAARHLGEGENRCPADHREDHRVVRLRLGMLTREKRESPFDVPSVVLRHDETPWRRSFAVRLTGSPAPC